MSSVYVYIYRCKLEITIHFTSLHYPRLFGLPPIKKSGIRPCLLCYQDFECSAGLYNNVGCGEKSSVIYNILINYVSNESHKFHN